MPDDWQRRALQTAAGTIRANAELLTELDSAIGDGDHGSNMTRGFDAVGETAGELAGLPPGQMLQKAGMTLVSKVGGASGPLYGSLFMAMGKTLGDGPLDARTLADAFGEGIAAVKKRGRSDAGEKTMLDVLVPAHRALADALDAGETGASELARCTRDAAEAGLARTRDLQATKGRAAYLGERSVGHLDPGAQSSCLLIAALAELAQEPS
jgi:dihydroxyacetone kinase-like protein